MPVYAVVAIAVGCVGLVLAVAGVVLRARGQYRSLVSLGVGWGVLAVVAFTGNFCVIWRASALVWQRAASFMHSFPLA
jgi:hypothetical protein